MIYIYIAVNIVVQPGDFSGTDNGEFIICGLVGVAGWIGKKEEDALRTMLVLDSVRGEHSAGIAAISNANKTTVVKRMGDPFYLLNSKEYEGALRGANRAIIGHNRYATMGGISEETAHPFDFDTLVGAHNGTLQGKWRLDDENKFKVDSENLYHHIDKKGLDDALTKIQGAWSLVWWDKVNETLNFLRNKERPMWITSTLDNTTILWASEKWMLEVACAKTQINHHEPWITAVDSLITFDIGVDRKINKPKVKKAESTYVPPAYYKNGGHQQQAGFLTKHGGVLSPAGTGTNHLNKIDKEVAEKHGKAKLSLVKKPIVATISPATIAEYISPEERVFEITGSRIDEKGARYVSLMDVVTPGHPVRLYLRKADVRFGNMLGRELIGNVSGFVNGAEGEYFKVSPHGVRLAPITAKVNAKKIDEVEDEDNLLLYMGANRRLLSKKDWSNKYHNCCFCFDKVYPEDPGNRITPEGEILCGSCNADLPEQFNGVKLMSVI